MPTKTVLDAFHVVKKVHPNATQSGSIWRNPNCEIYPDDSGESICIGRGNSPADAWIDAAEKVKVIV